MTEPTLPPLPEPAMKELDPYYGGSPLQTGAVLNWYTADQLRAAQLAAIEPYRRDAMRYQWLRKSPWNWTADGTPRASPWVVVGGSYTDATPINGDELDAAIDAAMRQEGEKQ